jgi:hypothetical protein
MPKHGVLSLKPQLWLEWQGQDGQSETEQPDHSASLGDSITSSNSDKVFGTRRGAGVAGSAIVVLVSTLAATGTVPVAAVGIILGVHRLMSSAFVAVNVLGNTLAAIVIAGWEGAVDRAALSVGLTVGSDDVGWWVNVG